MQNVFFAVSVDSSKGFEYSFKSEENDYSVFHKIKTLIQLTREKNITPDFIFKNELKCNNKINEKYKLEDCAGKSLTKEEMEIIFRELENLEPFLNMEIDCSSNGQSKDGYDFFIEKPTQNLNKKVIIQSIEDKLEVYLKENDTKHKIEHYMTKGLFFDRKVPQEFFENVFIKVNSDNSLVFNQRLRGGFDPLFIEFVQKLILAIIPAADLPVVTVFLMANPELLPLLGFISLGGFFLWVFKKKADELIKKELERGNIFC